MQEVDRRRFLRLGLAGVAGAAIGRVMPYAGIAVNKVVEEATGHPAGNANYRAKIEATCENSNKKLDCMQSYQPSAVDKVITVIIAPVEEEIVFRGCPSFLLSMYEGKDPFKAVVFGTGELRMTRRELGWGMVTSLFFGGVHNITDRGIDTNTIPAAQTLAGFIQWYMQRKFGIISNTLAHSMYNFRAVIG